jgi:hypothetical protein
VKALNDDLEKPPPYEFSDATVDQLSLAEAKSKELRAFFSNRIYVQRDGLHLRMTFGERVGGDDLYHFSIVVPNGDAFMMGNLITEMAQASLVAQAEAAGEDGS